jgi:hypothetical protein
MVCTMKLFVEIWFFFLIIVLHLAASFVVWNYDGFQGLVLLWSLYTAFLVPMLVAGWAMGKLK